MPLLQFAFCAALLTTPVATPSSAASFTHGGSDGLGPAILISGDEESNSTTSYWYGGSLHPLVVTRDGVNYRLIGKGVVEAIGGEQPTQSYLQADRLGSVRMVTNDEGQVVQSLSYDDYGLTRIAGQSAAASFDSMASFYRFQGQEQEVFPLAKLGIEDEALGAWLDETQLYHYPWRDYAAGLAAFIETDPIPTEDSLYAALGANPVNYTDETGGVIGTLANIDETTIRLLDRAETRDVFTPAEGELLRELLRRVESETFAELYSRFAIGREWRVMQFSWIRDMEISRARARIERERGGGSMILSQEEQFRIQLEAVDDVQQNPSNRLVDATWGVGRFLSQNEYWLNHYTTIREAWLERYAGPIRRLRLVGDPADSESSDEKQWVESSDSEEIPRNQIAPPIAPPQAVNADGDSDDDDVMSDFPTGGPRQGSGQNLAPDLAPLFPDAQPEQVVHPESNDQPQGGSPPRDERIGTCCNIL